MSEKEIKQEEQVEVPSQNEETPQEEKQEAVEETTAEEPAKEEETPQTETPEAPAEEVAEASTEKVEVATITAEEDKGAHDDFDWSVDHKHNSNYDEKEHQRLEELYTGTLTTLTENEIIKGKVVGVTDTDAVINVGFKSDGLVPLSEFKDLDELKVGDEVDVYLESLEDKQGQLLLSRKKAKLVLAWDSIKDSYENDKVIKGVIVSKTKGGLIVNVGGLETFLPGSQIDVKPIVDYDSYVGAKMEFKVVKINEAIKNAVVSHKALIESDLEEQRMEIISKLEKGQVLEGTIKNITDFGAFIDLGGVDGLLYITDISWGRINHPNEVLEINQKLNVVVLDYDDDKKRISLGLKQLQEHPWDTLSTEIEVGSKVNGKIVNIEDYGAFLEITPGVEGLIHVSEVTWANQPVNARDFFDINKDYEAVVMTIDREERKMSLSLKRLTPDPWEKIAEKYPVGHKLSGDVKNITPYGVFVELEEGIGGMVHISDLSWTKRFNHPSEFVKVGENLDIVVLDIDMESRKLTLGHKQIEEDPWDTFEDVFPVGSVHEATLIDRDDKGGKVLLQYGLEAYAPIKHLKKEDGALINADEKAEFKVIEFNRNDKRILVSHSRLLDDSKREAAHKEGKERKASNERASKAVQRINKNIEKTTLGDLGVLSELKEKMDADAKSDKKDEAKKATKSTESGKTKEEAPAENTEADKSSEDTAENAEG